MATQVEKKTAVLYGGRVNVEFTPGNHRYKVTGIDDFHWLPSVTAITGMLDKPALVPWATKMAVKYLREWIEENDHKEVSKETMITLFERAGERHAFERDNAALIGSEVHAFCEAFGLASIANEKHPEIPECENQVMYGIKAFTDWIAIVKPKFVAAEKIVASMKYGYTGIIDSIQDLAPGTYSFGHYTFELAGGRYVVDYKTSKGIWPEAYIQTAGYQHAHQEESGEKIKGRIILRLDKETGDVQVAVAEGQKAFKRDFKVFSSLIVAKRELRDLESELKK